MRETLHEATVTPLEIGEAAAEVHALAQEAMPLIGRAATTDLQGGIRLAAAARDQAADTVEANLRLLQESDALAARLQRFR